jgi:hypothetical protein
MYEYVAQSNKRYAADLLSGKIKHAAAINYSFINYNIVLLHAPQSLISENVVLVCK